MLEAAAEILWDSTKNKDNQKTFIFNEHVNRQYLRNRIRGVVGYERKKTSI